MKEILWCTTLGIFVFTIVMTFWLPSYLTETEHYHDAMLKLQKQQLTFMEKQIGEKK